MTARPALDYNAQTALDMETARRSAKLDVAATRAFIHGEQLLALALLWAISSKESMYRWRSGVENP